jgi:hypothetical protein
MRRRRMAIENELNASGPKHRKGERASNGPTLTRKPLPGRTAIQVPFRQQEHVVPSTSRIYQWS